ncbi:MAG: glutaredoxin domain-containing protein [Desulfomonilaceae bacterium]
MGDAKKLMVYGATWCPDARRSRKFLDDKGIAYRWIDIDEDPSAKDYVKKVNKGKVIIPTILFEDGSTLVEPSNEELAKKLGV